jgi:iron(III) transport system ATP-binding protein
VTHDQSEAMTTADLIAVMNRGRIEQLGTPKEIYDRPISAFVARFIGGSNILEGKALDADRVSIGGAALRTTGRLLKAGETIAVSVRQHDVEVLTSAPTTSDRVGNDNVLHAVIARQVFLGGYRDYTVVLDDKTEMRATVSADTDIPPGQEVWLKLPAAKCRALMEGNKP